MNQGETTWLRKIIFPTIVILTLVSSVVRVQPAIAQVTPANFDTVDAYISTAILFQPDVGWVAVVSGVFAIAWGLLRTAIVISSMSQALEEHRKIQSSNTVI